MIIFKNPTDQDFKNCPSSSYGEKQSEEPLRGKLNIDSIFGTEIVRLSLDLWFKVHFV